MWGIVQKLPVAYCKQERSQFVRFVINVLERIRNCAGIDLRRQRASDVLLLYWKVKG